MQPLMSEVEAVSPLRRSTHAGSSPHECMYTENLRIRNAADWLVRLVAVCLYSSSNRRIVQNCTRPRVITCRPPEPILPPPVHFYNPVYLIWGQNPSRKEKTVSSYPKVSVCRSSSCVCPALDISTTGFLVRVTYQKTRAAYGSVTSCPQSPGSPFRSRRRVASE